ncbi:Rrf2 family protein [Paenibacillus shirakamiensis]|uniref:Rrf2 family protein n=1 Tax=Paenibacillus shirakamiensis TaxID=1265935 RepID=A0ABS4JD70_9BACL|nr:Rrf2 family transcriptional regulator [Paenibacillus shirakamiensis]MBP1999654.1 Rrf2 family protein [Paenibacillus shirakamiensis]
MKLSNAYIQSIAIVVMLAELPEGVNLKSIELSNRMKVSHTYLQKIAKKLKDAEIITSEASKNGGYSLNKSVKEISFYDLFVVIESQDSFLEQVNYDVIYTMFHSETLVAQYGELAKQIFLEAENSFKNSLKNHFISEVVPLDKNGNFLEINWKKLLNE